MAKKRMFSLQIVDTDAFLDMPLSSQNLYFHLCMRADDDGFVNNPKKIMKMVSCNDDDMKVLLSKRFLLSFESGIIVIKHWKIHNYIAKDRYTETTYLDEKSKLLTNDNGSYTDRIQDVYICDTQYSIDKISIDKCSKDIDKELDIDNLSKLLESYPTKCPIRSSSTNRSVFDKKKAISIIKTHGIEYCIEVINLYVQDCKKTNTYLKAFKTFINNFPSKDDFESLQEDVIGYIKPQSKDKWEVKEIEYND